MYRVPAVQNIYEQMALDVTPMSLLLYEFFRNVDFLCQAYD